MLPITVALIAGAAQASATAAPPSDVIGRMVALYDEVCLKTFPSDTEVDALMARKGAKPLTVDEVKVTLGSDPGRGWLIKDGERDIQVYLELPPYHACTVRRMTPAGMEDDSAYRQVVEPYKATHAGFAPGGGMDTDMGELHVHAVTEARTLPDGSSDSLMVFDQRIKDPARRAKNESAVSLRFVHQLRVAD